MNELGDIRVRMTALEDEVSQLRESRSECRRVAISFDRDLTDLNTAFSGHKRVIQALRDTQLEQGRELAEHRVILAELRETQLEQGRELAGHRVILAEHGGILAEHGEALTAIMAELRGHGRILARLDPGDRSVGT